MKKQYTSPTTLAVVIQATHQLLAGSEVGINSEKEISNSSSILSRRRGSSFWDDEEE